MAMNDWLNKAKSMAGFNNDEDLRDEVYDYPEDHYDDYPEEEPVVNNAVPTHTTGGQTMAHSNAMKVVVIEPKTFEEAGHIINQLRDNRPVLVNFENTDSHAYTRILDFISGATYALDGNIEKVGKDIYMCVPAGISIDHSEDAAPTDIAEQFAWTNLKA